MCTKKRRYLNTKQAAEYLGMSPKTLINMRITGKGPRYSKVSRRVIYDIADVDRWIVENKRRFTGEAVRRTPECAPECGPECAPE